ncbi:MAG: BrxA family protein, partial [Limnohabitans sp.]
CRRYEFVKEFAQEVLRENYVLMRSQVTLANFDAFLNSKALWHEELDQLAKSTQSKLRQNLFRMMREAGFINDHYGILQALPSPALVQLLAQRGADELTIFPVSDLDIKRWLQ